MKSTFLTIALILFLGSLSCKKSSPVTPAQCSNTISTEYSTALNVWLADPTNNTKCKAVVDILGKLLNCPGVAAVTKTEYQKLLNDSPCK